MVPVRKAYAGSDSHGHVWPEDGAVVHMDYDLAMELVAIPDGGFSVVELEEEDGKTVEEPAPEPAAAVDEAPKPRRTRSSKAKPADTIEE